MKRKFVLLLAAVLAVMVFGFVGCGSDDNNVEEIQKTEVKLANGSPYRAYMSAMAQAIEEANEDIVFNMISDGSAVENINLVVDESADMAMTQTDVADYAQSGSVFFKKPVTGFSALGACYAQVCQLVVAQHSNINSVADLKGKTVSFGETDSVSEYNAASILKAYGLSFSDVEMSSLNYSDSVEALKNGDIDAIFFTSGAPAIDIMEMAVTDGVRVIEISGDEADALMESQPYYVSYTIPAGTYPNQADDIKTIAVKTLIIVRSDLDENIVYRITKSLFENKDVIAESAPKAGELNGDFAVEGVTVPFHAGAERYYKEIGAL